MFNETIMIYFNKNKLLKTNDCVDFLPTENEK